MKFISYLKEQAILSRNDARSAWSKGVCDYESEFIEFIEENYDQFLSIKLDSRGALRDFILNSARDFREFSYSGSSLVYNEDIALRLCTPSELKKCKDGLKNPNSRESWLDVQARALNQAFNNLYFDINMTIKFYDVLENNNKIAVCV